MLVHLATTLLKWSMRLLPDEFYSKTALGTAVLAVCRERDERIREDARP